jgi:uncharacterized protein (DUF58 family)
VKLTSLGWVSLFFLFWIPLAAIFTVNNFLFMIFGMMVGFVLLSHWLALRNITGVSIIRRLTEDLYACTPFPVEYEITTTRRHLGGGGLTIHEQYPFVSPGNGLALPHADSGKKNRHSVLLQIDTRGDHNLEPLTLSSSFPFGVGLCAKKLGQTQSILVFPQIVPVDSDIPAWITEPGKKKERVDPFGGIPYQFRQYVPGDPYKHIDWKKTASTGELITRVLSDEAASDIVISLSHNASERAISRAASLVVHFSREYFPVTLQVSGESIGPGRGPEFTRRLLTILARWENTVGQSFAPANSGSTVVEIDDKGNFLWHMPNKQSVSYG